MNPTTEETNSWNADKYNKHANFVSELGLPVVALLDPQKNEKILDLGCGDGTLALELVKHGAEVIAIDLSQEEQQAFMAECREILKEKIYTDENGWVADYVRIRLRGIKD